MLWEIGNIGIIAIFGVIGVDSDNLVVLLALIEHAHDANGLGAEEGEGDDRLLHQDQDIQGIVVFAVGLRDEPVVVRVGDRTEENAINVEETGGLVELVFDLGATGNLNDCKKMKKNGGLEVGEEGRGGNRTWAVVVRRLSAGGCWGLWESAFEGTYRR